MSDVRIQRSERKLSRKGGNEVANDNWKWHLGRIGVVLAFLAAWELVPRTGLVHEIILPPFSAAASELVALLQSPRIWADVRTTILQILAGFTLGVILGLTVGLTLGLFQPFKKLVFPLVVAFYAIPKIILVPLIITWFGYGPESKIVLAMVVSFFPLLVNSMVGMESVPENAIRLMRSLGASRFQQFWKVSLPSAAPIIFAGVETAMTLAVAGTIVGQFVGASEGLGYLVASYSYQLRIARVFAVIILLSILVWMLYALVSYIHRKLVFWDASLDW